MAKNVDGSPPNQADNSPSCSDGGATRNGLDPSPVAGEGSPASDQVVVMGLKEAVQEVIRNALATPDGVAKGLHEAAKALDRRQALLCILAENCDEPMYIKLVEALCNSHLIPLVKVEDKRKLGEWVGLCKIDRDGHARKVVPCSCAVVKDFGVNSAGLEYLKANIVV